MDVFAEIRNALSLEERIVVATIVSASGSSPAPLLSRMVITRGGLASMGTIGGGCMEGDVLLHAPRVQESGVAELHRFTLDDDGQGMICGGTIEVLVEPVSRADAPVYETLIRYRNAGERCALVTQFGPDLRVRAKSVSGPGSPEVPVPAALIDRAFAEHCSILTRSPGGLSLVEPIEGEVPVLVFGGGHVSRAISRVAATAGFRITVVDDRPKFAHPGRFPEAAETMVADFAAIGEIVRSRQEPYVLIVTRGHRHDQEILRQVVHLPTRYIGMIGSRRKVLAAHQRLIEEGVSAERLERVHAPMGLAIGALTPEEIAVSVVAEMIAVRRGKAGGRFGHLSEGLRAVMPTDHAQV